MELSTQDKAKIFALYLNAEDPIICTRLDDEDKTQLMLSGISNFDECVFVTDMDGGIEWHEDFDNVQLLLKPLSEISNDDAIEVGNLGKYISKEWDLSKVEDGFAIMYINKKQGFTEWVKFDCFNFNQADYLRSKGYALSYKGIDLFESGIAINISTKTTL